MPSCFRPLAVLQFMGVSTCPPAMITGERRRRCSSEGLPVQFEGAGPDLHSQLRPCCPIARVPAPACACLRRGTLHCPTALATSVMQPGHMLGLDLPTWHKAPVLTPAEYCARGSLADVLRAAKGAPAKMQHLTWLRRLNMALDATKGMLYL